MSSGANRLCKGVVHFAEYSSPAEIRVSLSILTPNNPLPAFPPAVNSTRIKNSKLILARRSRLLFLIFLAMIWAPNNSLFPFLSAIKFDSRKIQNSFTSRSLNIILFKSFLWLVQAKALSYYGPQFPICPTSCFRHHDFSYVGVPLFRCRFASALASYYILSSLDIKPVLCPICRKIEGIGQKMQGRRLGWRLEGF